MSAPFVFPPPEGLAFPVEPLHITSREFLEKSEAVRKAFPFEVGMKNLFTDDPILTLSDYEDYVRLMAASVLIRDRVLIQCSEKHEKTVSILRSLIDKSNSDIKTARRRPRIFFSVVAVITAIVLSVAIPSTKESAYDSGFASGKSSGYTDGYNAGKKYGYNEGEAVGYKSGYSDGKADGYNDGYSDGKTDGYSYGYSDGAKASTVSDVPSRSIPVVPDDPGESDDPDSYTVYVSKSGKIHKKSNCSGMKWYNVMTYSEAISAGYTHCSKCY